MNMSKKIISIISILMIISVILAACSAKTETTDTTTTNSEAPSGFEDVDTEYGFETEQVTDKDGKDVTDASGNKVTTEVAVIYTTNAKGKIVAQKIDNDGNPVTNAKGNQVTVKSDTADKMTTKSQKTTKAPKKKNDKNKDKTDKNKEDTSVIINSSTKPQDPTGTTNPSVATTQPGTVSSDDEKTPPSTSEQGKEVTFSVEDQQIVANMLEVPYLFQKSFESNEKVPIEIAKYAAVWMAKHNGSTATKYPSSPVVLDLFKFFGKTVVNFKTQCNDTDKDNTIIKYEKSDDTFTMDVNSLPDKVQTVTINKIYDLGENYYKVDASVTGAGSYKKVVAVIQKNRLDASLGFSIKALKWS